jgi:hypothetical protein
VGEGPSGIEAILRSRAIIPHQGVRLPFCALPAAGGGGLSQSAASALIREEVRFIACRIKVLYEEFERLQKIITALKKDNEEKSASLNALVEKV